MISSAQPDHTCEIPCSPRRGRCWDPPTGGKSSFRVGRAEASEMPDHRSKYFSPHQAICGSHWPARTVAHGEQRGRACPSSTRLLPSLSMCLPPSTIQLPISRPSSVCTIDPSFPAVLYRETCDQMCPSWRLPLGRWTDFFFFSLPFFFSFLRMLYNRRNKITGHLYAFGYWKISKAG